MKRTNPLIFVLLFISIFLSNKANAQNGKDELTNEEQEITVDSIGNKLMATYVFPDVAKEMSALISENFKKGNYNAFISPRDFANQLTKDLISISNDKHIRVNYNPTAIVSQKQVYTTKDSLNFENQRLANLKRDNFGFKELSILEGNIGYLDLRIFSDVKYAKATAVAAMNFLSSSDAIIIDLRMNRGGSPDMIQLITSYLYDSKPVHLNTFYWRPTDSFTETWTLSDIQGVRRPKRPVYVLISKSTFSAAEEFSYNLKNLRRATLIGETTGGGAHPGGPVNATNKFSVWVPSGRAINPITNTNWEGTGVAPNIEVPADQALDKAQITALELLLENNPELEKYYNWHLSSLKIKQNPVSVESSVLKSYAGSYGRITITFKDGQLYYQRDSGMKYKLIPLSQELFMINNGRSDFRIDFLKVNEKAIEINVHSYNGFSEKIPRMKN